MLPLISISRWVSWRPSRETFKPKTRRLFPTINVANYFGGGESNSLQPDISDIHHFTGNLSKIVGSHNFKFGGEFSSSNFQAFYNNASVDLCRATDPESCQSGRHWKRIGLLDLESSRLRRPPQRSRNRALGRSAGILFPGSVESHSKDLLSISDFDMTAPYQPPYGRNGFGRRERRH